MGRRLTRPEHYEQLKGQKCAVRLIRPDAQAAATMRACCRDWTPMAM